MLCPEEDATLMSCIWDCGCRFLMGTLSVWRYPSEHKLANTSEFHFTVHKLLHRYYINYSVLSVISLVQFIPLTIWVMRGIWATIQQAASPGLISLDIPQNWPLKHVKSKPYHLTLQIWYKVCFISPASPVHVEASDSNKLTAYWLLKSVGCPDYNWCEKAKRISAAVSTTLQNKHSHQNYMLVWSCK